MRLHNQNVELGLAVNTKSQKLDHEVEINKPLRVEKEGFEHKISKSTAKNQKLMEEVARLKEEIKKFEGGKRYFQEKIS